MKRFIHVAAPDEVIIAIDAIATVTPRATSVGETAITLKGGPKILVQAAVGAMIMDLLMAESYFIDPTAR